MNLICILIILLFEVIVGCGGPEHSQTQLGPKDPGNTAQKISFLDVNQKIFIPKCVACHGNSGGVNLENFQEAKKHLDAINQAAVIGRRMPKAPYPALTEEEVQILSAWIQAGGPETLPSQNPNPPAPALEPKFESIKKTILENKCLVCHKPNGSAKNVVLDTAQAMIDSPYDIVLPGNPEESGLVLVLQPDANKKMPPPSSGISPVKSEEIHVIEEWIRNGAKD